MRIGSTMLVGTAALALAFTAGSALAATRYYHHHRHHAVRAPAVPAAQNAFADTSQNGNNPAKRYAARHMSDGAIKTPTLYLTGNNPTKRYAVRHASADALARSDLTTSGNNPAKNYAVTAAR